MQGAREKGGPRRGPLARALQSARRHFPARPERAGGGSGARPRRSLVLVLGGLFELHERHELEIESACVESRVLFAELVRVSLAREARPLAARRVRMGASGLAPMHEHAA